MAGLPANCYTLLYFFYFLLLQLCFADNLSGVLLVYDEKLFNACTAATGNTLWLRDDLTGYWHLQCRGRAESDIGSVTVTICNVY